MRVNHCDLSFETSEANLACEEILLNEVEEGGDGVFRFWESERCFVVVGYSNEIEKEVNVTACREMGVPILRRLTGGGTVVQGPGCLNYSLVLPIDSHHELRDVTSTNRWIMEQNRQAIAKCLNQRITIEGVTDLALNGLKFSGNAQRRKRRSVLFHGTFLYEFNLALVENLLRFPSSQPEYRDSRSHTDFITNLPLDASAIKTALKAQWNANSEFDFQLEEEVRELAASKYSGAEWNERR